MPDLFPSSCLIFLAFSGLTCFLIVRDIVITHFQTIGLNYKKNTEKSRIVFLNYIVNKTKKREFLLSFYYVFLRLITNSEKT